MKALDVLNDFLKLSAFGEAPQTPASSAPASNMVEAPIMSGQPPIRPTIASNSPAAVAESRPVAQSLKPATDLKNFKIK
jgi:hypothetical protein